MKHFLTVLQSLLLILFLDCVPDKATNEEISKHPNILLIISDDQAWTDYSFMGHSVIETPRIDRLAEEGLTFTRGYVVAPLCRPSLASISTGLYPHQHRITGNDPLFESDQRRYSTEWMEQRSQENEPYIQNFQTHPTVASLLGNIGYVSYQTGKWWEGNHKRGGFTDGMTHGDAAKGGRHGDEGLKVSREGMKEAFDFMIKARDAEKPFFVWHAPFMPHTPHTPPDSLFQKYLPHTDHERIAKYMAMVEWFDITVGQLLDFLADNGMDENTMVFYVCDNGWITNPDPKNGGVFLPRSKQSPYEMGIRTPIMVKWPGVVKPVMDTTTFVSSIDIVPTILSATGLVKAEQMLGVDMLDRTALNAREMIFSEDFMHDMQDQQDITKSLESRVVLKSPWKLIMPFRANNDKEVELFNIVDDPHEKQNLADDFPQTVAELSADLDRFWTPQQ